MEKVFVVNKPKGKTSYQIVAEFKRRYPGEKVGHAGTLDPLAEGVLIVLVGKATKKQSEFMALEKEYLVEAVFGIVTSTWDLEGKPEFFSSDNLKARLGKISAESIKRQLWQFVGEIDQIVPAFSAVKVAGQRLYRLARKGKIAEAELPVRKARVYKIQLESFKLARFPAKEKITPQSLVKYGPKAVLRMTVGKGTYVRSLIYQLGQKMMVGATVTKLTRTRIGEFRLDPSLD